MSALARITASKSFTKYTIGPDDRVKFDFRQWGFVKQVDEGVMLKTIDNEGKRARSKPPAAPEAKS